MHEDVSSVTERVDVAYRADLAEYLTVSRANEAWLTKLRGGMEWMLEKTEADAWKALADSERLTYIPEREEKPPTKGREFLELAQRRHTAATAMVVGELIWGSGYFQIRGVDPTSISSLTQGLSASTSRLIEVLAVTPPEKRIVQRNTHGEVARELTAQQALKDLVGHERQHLDLGRILLDGATAIFPSSYQRTAPQTPVREPVLVKVPNSS